MDSLTELNIRDVQSGDAEKLRPLLDAWIRDSETGEILTDEVESALLAIDACVHGDRARKYVVVESVGGVLLGVMGLTTADAAHGVASSAAVEGKAAELINAFIDPSTRGQGIGKLLVSHLEETAKNYGYEEIVVTSGPRYRETGWPFWRSRYGEPTAILKDAFGPDIDAPVWRKSLIT